MRGLNLSYEVFEIVLIFIFYNMQVFFIIKRSYNHYKPCYDVFNPLPYKLPYEFYTPLNKPYIRYMNVVIF